jgi:hypothetical protein
MPPRAWRRDYLHEQERRQTERLRWIVGIGTALALALGLLVGCRTAVAPIPCTLETADWVDTVAWYWDGRPAVIVAGCDIDSVHVTVR